MESNSSHSDCECSHLTSFALLTSTSGLVGSEVARSIGSGILFDSDTFVSGNPGDEDDAASSTTTTASTTHVLTLEIATYLVSTICLLILVLILVQVSPRFKQLKNAIEWQSFYQTLPLRVKHISKASYRVSVIKDTQ